MQKSKIPKELQVGLLTIGVIALIIIGLSYLKGYSVLATTDSFYALFSDVKGLKPGDQVLVQGHQIGQVSEIYYDNKTHNVVVLFWINNELELPKDTKAQIFAKDLLGTMSIRLILGKSKTMAESGDTLAGEIAPAMTDELKDNIMPIAEKLDSILVKLNTTITGINTFMEDTNTLKSWKYNISQTLTNTKKLTANSNDLIAKLKQTSDSINTLITENKNNFNKISKNVVGITNKTNEALPAFKNNLDTLQQTLNKLNILLDSLNKGNGTAAKFINDPRVYNDLDKTINSLNDLLEELNKHPERFVHFSIFGRKQKQK